MSDKEISLEKLSQDLPEEWFDQCKTAIKSIKPARHALKGLHQAGTSNKAVRKILPDIGAAIKKISEEKTDVEERANWKNALWRFVSQFSEMSAEQLVRIYEQSLTQKPKIVDRTKMDKKRKDKKDRENIDRRPKTEKNKADIEAKRQKFKDQHRNKYGTYIKDDRKRKHDRDRPHDNYGKQWRSDHNPSRSDRPHDHHHRPHDHHSRPSAPY